MTHATLKACLISALWIASDSSWAIQPVSGKYAGVSLGATYTPNIDFNFNPSAISSSTINQFESSLASFFNIPLAEVQALLSNTTLPNKNIPGTVSHSVLGGIEGDFGYRICSDYRIEGELLYNNNPFSQLTIGNYTVTNDSSDPNFHISGDTNTLALLFNFLYDIPITSKSGDGYAALRPYLGVGVGYAYIFSDLKFHYGENIAEQAQGAEPATLYEANLRRNVSAAAVQGIIGLSYFIDDFCWLSLDARYFTTPLKTDVLLSNSGVNYQSQIQLFSVMIGFHGAFGHETK